MQKITDIKKWNYGVYSSDNYGAHTQAIEIGTRKIYFSYDTIIAFCGTNSKGEYFNCVHCNDWGTTTGKHLNFIDGGNKGMRLSDDEFNKQLKKFIK